MDQGNFLLEPLMEDVDPELRGQDQEVGADHLFYDGLDGEDEVAARADVMAYATAPAGSARTTSPAPTEIESCPHAALALAMASTTGATWGTSSHGLSSSGGSTMEPPEDEDQQIDECSSEWSDFG